MKRISEQINFSYLLRHHYSALYLIIILALAVSWQNLTAATALADEFGQHNLLYPLVTDEYGIPISQIVDTGLDNIKANGNIQNDLNIPSDTPIILTEDGAAILKPHLVTTQPGVAGRKRIEYYEVKAGDTISSIAQQFGLNLNTILWENRLTVRSLLRIGQRLTILPTNGLSYRIGRGDTVAKIAKKFAVSINAINEFNNLTDKLTIGQTIVIPGAKPAYTPPPIPSAPPILPRPSRVAGPAATISGGRLQWPTVHRRLTQYFSWRHAGIDIADATGTPVYAAEDGIVEVAGWNRGGYGFYIIIDHGGGMKTLYAHNSKLFVTVGDRVGRGQQIAAIGSTGRSTGPHVHFEVRIYGVRTNPLLYTR